MTNECVLTDVWSAQTRRCCLANTRWPVGFQRCWCASPASCWQISYLANLPLHRSPTSEISSPPPSSGTLLVSSVFASLRRFYSMPQCCALCYAVSRGYMWNKIISKSFQPSSTSVWSNFISARGNLPEIISKLFHGLVNIFQRVHCRGNNFERILEFF